MEFSPAENMLLEATAAAARGGTVAWMQVAPEDWRELAELAAAHKLLPLVLEAVHGCPAAESLPGREALRREAIRQTALQVRKTADFLRVWQALEKAGLHPLAVKGLLCRQLYPQGDCRVSADEDLLVTDDEAAACGEVLRSLGLRPTAEPEPDAFETGWRAEDGLLYIELHRRLFPPDSGALGGLNGLLSGAEDRAEEYPAEPGRSVRSLCPHDHLLYLLLHAYKHFIHSGFGIRQVCDIGLWAETYAGRIDWDRLYDQCGSVRAQTFAAAVMAIAREHLGLGPELPARWRENAVDCAPMLKDLLSAGVYGSRDMSRRHSASLTLNAVEARHGGGRSGVLATVFPGRKQLERRYPVLKKHPAALPAVWCLRLFRYGRETRSDRNNSAAGSLRIARERTGLLKQYGILD